MAEYTQITIEEFESHVKADKGWTKTLPNGAMEFVFEWKVPNTCAVIKVYSSITPNGKARKCGGDAIRVCAILRVGDNTQGLIATRRVHRVKGWRDNLQKRVLSVVEEAKKRVRWGCNVKWAEAVRAV